MQPLKGAPGPYPEDWGSRLGLPTLTAAPPPQTRSGPARMPLPDSGPRHPPAPAPGPPAEEVPPLRLKSWRALEGGDSAEQGTDSYLGKH